MYKIAINIMLLLANSCFLFAQIKPNNEEHGKEYHVSINGNNVNDGSKNYPFKTIMAAASVAMPGDIIIVHAGTYREQINPPRGGNSETERITYKAAQGEKVFIKGSEIVKGWTNIGDNVWQVKIANSFFGKFNPYKEIIKGDWFGDNGRIHHRGAVYVNNDWMMEAKSYDDMLNNKDEKNLLWFSKIENDTTTIFAQFGNKNPNNELVEINVRPTVFYPDKPFINYITVSGFTMEHAATNWAPPTAEQQGLIGTHWSKGWIIENNKILYSKCVGVSLGKYGDEYDNTSANTANGYVETINRALSFGWNKSTVGSHIVRNNEIAYCEQAGIVGSMGCSFSVVENNYVHHNYYRRLFGGAEMGGIKFHGAVDVKIIHNRICNNGLFGLWLDWMAQGTQVADNLFYNNEEQDVFIEVCHGPTLLFNNIFLSEVNFSLNSSGVVFAHNLFAGKIDVTNFDSRYTPYLKPHSTFVDTLHDNPSGDVKFYNNLFVNKSDVSKYSTSFLPNIFDGNVYTKGAIRINGRKMDSQYGEMHETAKKQLARYNEQQATETNYINAKNFNADVSVAEKENEVYLIISFNKNWLNTKRKLITTRILGKAIVPNLPYQNTDGKSILINRDYFNKLRNISNPSPGPFEIKQSGTQNFIVWQSHS